MVHLSRDLRFEARPKTTDVLGTTTSRYVHITTRATLINGCGCRVDRELAQITVSRVSCAGR